MWEPHAINTSNAEFNPICHLLALLGGHHILHVSRVRVKKEDKNANNMKESKRHTNIQGNKNTLRLTI
jgi:hypothetical protein